MKGVTKFMEGRPDFIVRQKHRFTSGGLGEVEVVRNHGAGAAQAILRYVGIHPSAPILIGAGV